MIVPESAERANCTALGAIMYLYGIHPMAIRAARGRLDGRVPGCAWASVYNGHRNAASTAFHRERGREGWNNRHARKRSQTVQERIAWRRVVRHR